MSNKRISWQSIALIGAVTTTLAAGCSSGESGDQPTPTLTSSSIDISRIKQLEGSVPTGGEFHYDGRLTTTDEIAAIQQKAMDAIRVEPPECGRVGSNGEQIPVGTEIEGVSFALPDSFVTLSAQELPTPRVAMAADAPDCSRFSFYSPQGDGLMVPVDGPDVPDATSTGSRTMTYADGGRKADQYSYVVWLDDTHAVTAIILPRENDAPAEEFVDPAQGLELLLAAVSSVRG